MRVIKCCLSLRCSFDVDVLFRSGVHLQLIHGFVGACRV